MRFSSSAKFATLSRTAAAFMLSAVASLAQSGLPVITSSTNTLGTVGQPFTYQITASGNPTSFGAFGLPAGLLAPTTNAMITGLPQRSGTFASQIMAVNANGATLTNLSIQINPPPAPVLASPVTVFGVQGQPLNYALLSTPNHSNVPTTFSVSGLPAGATLISNVTTNSAYANVLVTNYFINSPSLLTNGSFIVPVVVSNQGGVSTNNVTFIINGTNPPVFTISSNPVTATVGVPFNFDVTAVNNPLRFRVTSIQIGANPPVTGLNITNGPITNGLSFSNASSGSTVVGRIYGTPGATNAITLGLEAANNFGAAATNMVINVSYPTPTVILSQPLGEGNYVNGSSFYLNAQAFDEPENILVPSSYQFQEDGAALPGSVGILGDYFGVEYDPAANPSIVTASAQNALGQTTVSVGFAMGGVNPQAPMPSITMLPLNFGQQLVAGGKVVLSARATIPSATTTIQRVEFYVNKVYVGSSTAPEPNTDGVYEYEWTTPTTPGSYQVTARAVSVNFVQPLTNIPFWASVIARKPTIVNTKQGTAPSVAITSPANNGTLTIGVPNRIQATALLSGGSIDSVEFFANGRRIIPGPGSTATTNPDTGVPFEVDFTPNSFGAYEIYAIATGSNGLQTVSPVVVANVPTGFVPTVQVTSPTYDTVIPYGSSLVVAYTAQDSDGFVKTLELLVNGAVVDEFSSDTDGLIGNGFIPYTPPSQGVYEFTVRVTDEDGNVGQSEPVRVTVQAGATNPLPLVVLSALPIDGNYVIGSQFFYNASVTPRGATTIPSDGVNFVFGGALTLGAPSEIPYGQGYFAARGILENQGLYNAYATAKDSAGNIGLSARIPVNVAVPSNPLPIIEVLPLNPGTTVFAGGDVLLRAKAYFPATTPYERRVEFYANGAFLGSTTTVSETDPDVYTFLWKAPAKVGPYSIDARAIAANDATVDSEGNVVVSSYGSSLSDVPRIVNVGAATEPEVRITTPLGGTFVPVGSPLTIQSTASVAGSTIARVDYYANGAFLGSSVTAADSYSFAFTPSSKGELVLYAVAESVEGFQRESDPVKIVVPLAGDPTIEFLSPAAGITFVPGTTFTAAAKVTINPTLKAPIRDVRFFLNEVQQETPDTTAPYSQQITLPSVGNYFLKAIATDIYGNTAAVQRIVACEDPPAGTPPLITMTHPTPGGAGDTENDFSTSSDFFFNALVTLPAGVSVAPGGVKFFANGVPVDGVVNNTGNTYSIYWQPDQAVVYLITAQVTDSRGITAVSPPLQFTIAPQIRPLPTVNLLPPSSSSATVGSRVFLQVETNGGLTAVSRLDFYANGILIGSVEPVDPANGTTTTTLFEWTPTVAGTFSITARAIQVLGEQGDNSVISNARDLVIATPVGSAPIVSLRTPPIAESRYVSGSQLFLNATVASSSAIPSGGTTFYLGSTANTGTESRQFFNGLPVYAVQVDVPEVSQAGSQSAPVFATARDANNNIGSSFSSSLEFARSLSDLPTVQMLPVDTLQTLSAGSTVQLLAAARFPAQANQEARVEFYVNGALVGVGVPDAAAQADGSTIYRLSYTVPDIKSPTGEVLEFSFQARALALNFQTNAEFGNVRKFYGSIISAAETTPVYFVPTAPVAGSNEQFVVTYFRKLFFRAPTYTEYEYYLGLLQGGSTQSQVIVAMAQSEAFNDVTGVLFGYYLRMGMKPATYAQVTNYIREMTNVLGVVPLSSGMSAGISSDIAIPPSPYGATLGQANVAAALINANTNLWTNNLRPVQMSDTPYMQWMLRSFNSPYLPQNLSTNVLWAGDQTQILNTIRSFPATNSSNFVRFGHAYAFMSALYSVMPVGVGGMNPGLGAMVVTNFPPYMQSVAVNYLLSPTNSTNSWNTNLGPISATNITPLLAPVITNTGTNVLSFGAPYNLQVAGLNFVSNTTKFSASNLPSGLSINTNNGLISGTPTNSLVFTSSVTASNGPAAVGSGTFVFDVLPPPPGLAAASFTAYVGEFFDSSLSASNAPTNFSAASLPTGLTINASSGRISGYPSVAGSFTNPVQVRNRAGTASNAITFVVHSPFTRYLVSNGLSGVGALADADPDGDGLSNADEFAFGTKANTADTLPVSMELSGTTVTITWNRRINSLLTDKYTVQSVANLSGVWAALSPAPVPTSVSTNGDYETVRAVIGVPTSQPSIFYRVKSELPAGILP
jgi:hypothetical protein